MGAHDTNVSRGAFLVEGFRDMLKLRQEGFEGSLAIGGSSVSDTQLEELSTLKTKKVVIMMDGDKAGRSAAEKTAQKCCKFFDEVYITDVGDNRDPKDLSRAELTNALKMRTTRARLSKTWSTAHHTGEK
jgi:DNA primase